MDRRCTRFIDEYINCLNLSMELRKNTNCFDLLNEYKICNDHWWGGHHPTPKEKPTVKESSPKILN